MCLSAAGLNRQWRLHTERPSAALNLRAHQTAHGVEWRADLPSGVNTRIENEAPPSLVRVDISGPIEQFAGYYDACSSGYSDGHDAIAERLCAAFAEGDVLLVINSPGGAAAGLQQGVSRALKSKAAHGRRVTVWADEMIGSAATWWACAIGDEIFVPLAGQVGSIGARGEHVSIAGHLAQEGIVKTYFADPPDKIAFAPEFPLGPVGEARGNRDVKIAADAFRAAVCDSPIGLRNKLTPEALIELGADMLTGQAAVAAGLADGVAEFDDVVDYALGLADANAGEGMKTKEQVDAEKARARASSVRAEAEGGEGKPGEDPDKEPESERGTEPSGKCAGCGSQNEENAKFCDQCGGSMAAPKAAEPDEPPPSSKPAPAPGKPAEKAEEPKGPPMAKVAASNGRSFNAQVGAREDASLPALKGAALGYVQLANEVMLTLGASTPARGVGAFRALVESAGRDAARASAAESHAAEQVAKAEKASRWDLAKRLNALSLDGWPRANIFRDEVDAKGKRTAVGLAPMVASMDLDTLSGMVEGFEKNAKPRTPFESDRAKAETGAREQAAREGAAPPIVNGKPTPEAIKAATKDPAVVRMFNSPGNTHAIERIAEQYLITVAENSATIGGIQ